MQREEAELKTQNNYVIALRHLTWAQAHDHLKWLGEKPPVLKVEKQGRQGKDKSLVLLLTKENCFSKNLEGVQLLKNLFSCTRRLNAWSVRCVRDFLLNWIVLKIRQVPSCQKW